MNGSGTPQDYGTYTLTSATLLSLPAWTDDGGGTMTSTGPPNETSQQAEVRRRLTTRFYPYGKPFSAAKQSLAPQPKRMALVQPQDSIGVMDVGQGGCNMVIQGNEPVAYFDVGYPLWFYVGSVPANLHFGTGTYQGPIVNNQSGPIPIVLSHWDWDHWRLGAIAGMTNSQWVVAPQQVGPATQNFINGLANLTVFPNATPFVDVTLFRIVRCQPGANWLPAFVMNNSGLAVLVGVYLPVNDPNPHLMAMTGDANFTSLATGAVIGNLVAINAVHHGSIAHNASVNLPAPSAGYANGAIPYSYGIRTSATLGTVHCYGFPVPQAVTNYQNAAWTLERSTPEGPNINANPPSVANRGNVRVGDQTPLNNAYNNTAFAAFAYPIS